MLTAEQNDLLTRVSGDAPMGQFMRQYWLPACLSDEVSVPGGAPVRTTMLDIDIVIFRSPNGQLGAVYEYCLHRGVSLALARNEEHGLRCLYHGWKFSANGTIVEMPTEPAGSPARERLCHPSFPAVESGGLIWVYLGPKESVPKFDPMPWASCPPGRLFINKIEVNANWAQVMEGQIDSAHSSMLHSTEIAPGRGGSTVRDETGVHVRPSGDANPALLVKRVPYGMRYVAVRKPVENAQTHQYMRVTVFMQPCFAFIPPNSGNRLCNITVPRDDNRTILFFVHYSESVDIDESLMKTIVGNTPGVDFDPVTGIRSRNRDNNFLQNRKAMAAGNFTGISGIANQDIAMWESMGRKAAINRAAEHLGSTDVAVVHFRRLMMDAVNGATSASASLHPEAMQIARCKVASYEGVVPNGTDWESLGVSDEEYAISSRERNLVA